MARRKKGTGTWRRHGDGVEAAIWVRDPDSGNKRRITEQLSTPDEAEAWLDEQVWKIRDGRERELLGIPMERVFGELVAFKNADQTLTEGWRYEAQQIVVNHLLPYFGGWLLHEIDADMITAYINAKLAGTAAVAPGAGARLAPSTVNKHIDLIGQAFALARRRRYRADNPCEDVKRPPLRRVPAEALSPKEVLALLSLVPLEWLPPTETLLATGLRVGEGFGLRTFDVDLDQQLLRIRGKLKVALHGKLVWEPFLKKGQRVPRPLDQRRAHAVS